MRIVKVLSNTVRFNHGVKRLRDMTHCFALTVLFDVRVKHRNSDAITFAQRASEATPSHVGDE